MLNNLQAEIEKSAKKVVKDIKLNAPTDQGDLKKSVKYVITDNGFEVDALHYLDYIDKGINGIKKNVGSIYSYTLKKPPIKSLKGWSKRKGLNPYAVQNSIYNNGLKPKRFLRKADEEFDVDSLVVAYGKDIQEQMLDW
jgi:hypothetical protein